jgi:ABC-type uncharacterized transport system substrate-binding protein
MSYGANNTGLFRYSADIVDKILKERNPLIFLSKQPTKFELVVNQTANAELAADVCLARDCRWAAG